MITTIRRKDPRLIDVIHVCLYDPFYIILIWSTDGLKMNYWNKQLLHQTVPWFRQRLQNVQSTLLWLSKVTRLIHYFHFFKKMLFGCAQQIWSSHRDLCVNSYVTEWLCVTQPTSVITWACQFALLQEVYPLGKLIRIFRRIFSGNLTTQNWPRHSVWR